MRDNAASTPTHPAFADIVAEMQARAPSEEEVKRSREALEGDMRESRLFESGVRGAITDEDVAAIVTGKLKPTHALRTCQRWMNLRSGSVQRPFSILVLCGLSGRGKTLAAAWLLAQLGGRYATAETLRRMVVSNFAKEGAQFEALVATRCVCIDDAGGEHDANGAAAAMFEFVNRRVGHSKSWTLITANLTKEEFAERYGIRTVRRIDHQGFVFEVSGDDLRRRA